MEIIDFEQKMRDKLAECELWLVGKDVAVAKLEEARIAYESAKADVEQYTDEYIAEVTTYCDDLRAKLGIENVVEVHDEQVVEQCADVEIATDEIVERPLV